MAEVIILPVITRLNVPVERVLSAAADAELESAVVIGFKKDGAFYFASSYADGGDVLWLMALAQKKLLEVGDG